ncbi:FliH/SctL family protein [Thermogutta sp.]|jgi:flagellar assembly protein FliH|uniref:FliH/SctL family protein n=1 Tax=Thermogutta sp. TaxID=1962930 RepID=UPI00321FDBA0
MSTRGTTVIKIENTDLAARVTPFNFEDMADRAKRYLEEVGRQATQIVMDAKREAEIIKLKAEEEGKRKGFQNTEQIIRQELEKKLASLLPALKTAVTQISEARHELLREWERNLLGLAAAIAARMARRTIEKAPEVMLPLVREAVQLAAASPTMRIRLNPHDWEVLKPEIERLVRELAPVAHAEITADPSISRGGCRVETQFGIIDQELEIQAKRIVEELAGNE